VTSCWAQIGVYGSGGVAIESVRALYLILSLCATEVALFASLLLFSCELRAVSSFTARIWLSHATLWAVVTVGAVDLTVSMGLIIWAVVTCCTLLWIREAFFITVVASFAINKRQILLVGPLALLGTFGSTLCYWIDVYFSVGYI